MRNQRIEKDILNSKLQIIFNNNSKNEMKLEILQQPHEYNNFFFFNLSFSRNKKNKKCIQLVLKLRSTDEYTSKSKTNNKRLKNDYLRTKWQQNNNQIKINTSKMMPKVSTTCCEPVKRDQYIAVDVTDVETTTKKECQMPWDLLSMKNPNFFMSVRTWLVSGRERERENSDSSRWTLTTNLSRFSQPNKVKKNDLVFPSIM